MQRLIIGMLLCFLIVIAWGFAYGFSPKDLDGGDITHAGRCGDNVCVFVTKDGKDYMAVGEPVDGGLKIIAIYVIENDKPKLIFGKGLVTI